MSAAASPFGSHWRLCRLAMSLSLDMKETGAISPIRRRDRYVSGDSRLHSADVFVSGELPATASLRCPGFFVVGYAWRLYCADCCGGGDRMQLTYARYYPGGETFQHIRRQAEARSNYLSEIDRKDVASSANITASIHAAISVHNATGISGIY
jgi:hypothetical protein